MKSLGIGCGCFLALAFIETAIKIPYLCITRSEVSFHGYYIEWQGYKGAGIAFSIELWIVYLGIIALILWLIILFFEDKQKSDKKK